MFVSFPNSHTETDVVLPVLLQWAFCSSMLTPDMHGQLFCLPIVVEKIKKEGVLTHRSGG